MQYNNESETLEKSQEIEEEAESEELNFDKPDFEFIPNGNHEWRQEGPYLVCKSCLLQHAVWIGMERRMVGINEAGDPILEKRI